MQSIRYVDDSTLITETEKGLQTMMDSVVSHGKNYGMRINVAKTKVMRIAKQKRLSLHINIEGDQLDEVESFSYLGSIISSDGTSEKDIRTRIGAA